MTQSTVTAGRADTWPSDRRTLHITAGASSCTFICDSDLPNPDANVLAVPGNGITNLTSTKVTPPQLFFGLNTGQDSSQLYSAPTGITYGLARSHDTNGITWKDIETSAGVYNWSNFDQWVMAHGPRAALMFTVYQTPTFYSTNPSKVGPYSSLGWNMPPSDWSKLTNFITAAANRAVALGYPIAYWEICNEPNFVSGSSGIGKRFWGGTAADLSVMSRIVNQAAKSITPTAKIICPALTNWDNDNVLVEGGSTSGAPLAADVASTYFATMMAASDGAGGSMAQWIDVIGCHMYGSELTLTNRITAVKAAMSAAGVASKPIFDTETGFNLAATVSDYVAFQRIVRLWVTEIAMGLSAHCYYMMGGLPWVNGYTLMSRPALVQSLEYLFSEIRKHGIDAASRLSDGSVAFRCNNRNYLI